MTDARKKSEIKRGGDRFLEDVRDSLRYTFGRSKKPPRYNLQSAKSMPSLSHNGARGENSFQRAAPPPPPTKSMFQGYLQDSVDQATGANKLVVWIMEAIENTGDGFKTDAIFRASGNQDNLRSIIAKDEASMLEALGKEENVHTLTAALKRFFRDLKKPLIDYEEFNKAYRTEAPKDEIRILINGYPAVQKKTLTYLFLHLQKVLDNQRINNIGRAALGVIFGPTLMRISPNCENMADEMKQQNKIIEFILEEYDFIFEDNDDRHKTAVLDIHRQHLSSSESVVDIEDASPVGQNHQDVIENKRQSSSSENSYRDGVVYAKINVNSQMSPDNENVRVSVDAKDEKVVYAEVIRKKPFHPQHGDNPLEDTTDGTTHEYEKIEVRKNRSMFDIIKNTIRKKKGPNKTNANSRANATETINRDTSDHDSSLEIETDLQKLPPLQQVKNYQCSSSDDESNHIPVNRPPLPSYPPPTSSNTGAKLSSLQQTKNHLSSSSSDDQPPLPSYPPPISSNTGAKLLSLQQTKNRLSSSSSDDEPTHLPVNRPLLPSYPPPTSSNTGAKLSSLQQTKNYLSSSSSDDEPPLPSYPPPISSNTGAKLSSLQQTKNRLNSSSSDNEGPSQPAGSSHYIDTTNRQGGTHQSAPLSPVDSLYTMDTYKTRPVKPQIRKDSERQSFFDTSNAPRGVVYNTDSNRYQTGGDQSGEYHLRDNQSRKQKSTPVDSYVSKDDSSDSDSSDSGSSDDSQPESNHFLKNVPTAI